MADTERADGRFLCQDGTMGQIKIADDVIAVIAALAATEVEGVDSMAGNITHELIRKLGMKNLQKGVRIELAGEDVSCALSLNVACYKQTLQNPCPQGLARGTRPSHRGLLNLHLIFSY